MLPLRHSNKNSENMPPPPPNGSLIKKSSRPSLKCPELPYNGSASYYSNVTSPILAGASAHFRQRPRPIQLQTFQQSPVNSLGVPNYHPHGQSPLSVGAVYKRQPFRTGNPRRSLILSPPPPGSPGLDQVLTEARPGPNVVWLCERKRPKPTLWSYRNLLACAFVLAIIVLVVYKWINHAGGVHEDRQFEMKGTPSQDEPEQMNYNFTEEVRIDEVVKPNVVISNNNEAMKVDNLPTPPATIKILYSVNEDMESTVEVIED